MTVKIGVYLTDEVATRFRGALCRSGMTKSSIVNKALTLFLDPPPAKEPGQEALQRLRALGKHVRQLQREIEVASETLAVFVRYFLMVTPPVPERELPAARALGRERYEVFIRQIAKRIASDKSLITDVMRRIVETPPHLVAVPEAREQNAVPDPLAASGHAVRAVESAKSLSHA